MPTRVRLRRPTLVAAPLFVLGVMGSTAALATALWGAWNPSELDATFYVVEAMALFVGLGSFVAASGCFVDVDHSRDEVRDVVAWTSLLRIDRSTIVSARVRAGAWRWFELETTDGRRPVLLGIAPAQFPARLFPGARERDLADLDLLMGPDGDARS